MAGKTDTKTTDTETTPSVDELLEQRIQGIITRALSNHKGTFQFEWAIPKNDGFGNAGKAGISVQFDYPPGCDVEEFVAAAREAEDRAKTIVLTSLGLDVVLDDDGRVTSPAIQRLMRAFPGATLEDSGSSQQATQASAGDRPPYTDDQVNSADGDDKKRMQRANTAWGKARYNDGFRSEFWDNTESNKQKGWSNAPTHAHKTFKSVKFWADDK